MGLPNGSKLCSREVRSALTAGRGIAEPSGWAGNRIGIVCVGISPAAPCVGGREAKWKTRLQHLAAGTALAVLASHFAIGPGFAQTITTTGAVTPDVAPDPTSPWNVSGELIVGDEADGALFIGSGAEVSSEKGRIGNGSPNTGTVTVTGTGSQWTMSENLTVGYYGTGILNIESGGRVTTGGSLITFIGSLGGVGEVSVSGAGSQLNTGYLEVGNSDEGSKLVVENRGVVTAEGVSIGHYDLGTVTVKGSGSHLNNSGDLTIGSSGTGVLNIENAGLVSNVNASISHNEFYTSVVTVTGIASQWKNSGTLDVGRWGHAILAVENGGVVMDTSARLGVLAGALGEATVTGPGSQWINSGSLAVGWQGEGKLRIESGGTVFSTLSTLGLEGSGEVTVTGSGSQWAIDASLYVGEYGNGTLKIENGGTVHNVGGIMANYGGTSTATVTGLGSYWDNSGLVRVGRVGHGTLTIDQSGKVRSMVTILATEIGSTGIVHLLGDDSGRGVLETEQVVQGAGAATLDLDGGILRAAVDQTDFLSGFETVTVGSEGAWFDTNGHYVGVGTSFIGAGGLTKLGLGSLVLSGNGEFSGDTTVDGGMLDIAGSISNTSGYIGVSSAGEVTMTGAASVWQNSDALHVGYRKAGELTIDPGTRVTADTTTIATEAGSSGVVNLMGDASARGVLETGQVIEGDGAATLNLDGGILRATADQTDYLSGFDEMTIGGGGAWFDTNGHAIGLATTFTGSAGLDKVGAGSLTLDATHAYTGNTTVASGGTLVVNGSISSSQLLAIDGTLTGTGTVGKTVINSGGVLSGQQGHTLTVAGDLTLDDGSLVDVALGAPSNTALFNVQQNLTLDGTINVTDAGGFGAGVYRIIDYSGTLTDNGLEVGMTPTGASGEVQTVVVNEVNLVVESDEDGGGPGSAPATLFWNGAVTAADGVIHGGSGVWNAGPTTNWTDVNAASAYAWDGQFAVFQNNPAIVTVDDGGGAVSANGMQFIGTGWSLVGDAITLDGEDSKTSIRVGDGTLSGASASATIAAELAGASRLVKDDLGTLVLAGSNSYTGGTTINAGTLVVDGQVVGELEVLSGGRLQGSGTVDAIEVESGGVLAPGNSIGTLHASGNVIFHAGSFYDLELAADGSGDRLAVDGTVTLQGGTVRVTTLDPDTDYTDGAHYTFLTADGGLSGSFAGLSEDSAFLDFALGYGANGAFVDVALVRQFPDVALTFNQRESSGALAAFDLTPGSDSLAVHNRILLLDASGARSAFDLSSGEIYAATLDGAVREAAADARQLLDQARGPGTAGVSAWAAFDAQDGRVSEDGNGGRYTHNRIGGMLGLDYHDAGGRLAVGVSAGYLNGEVDLPARTSHTDTEGWRLGGYLRAGSEDAGLSATAAGGYASGKARVTRDIAIGALTRTATARVDLDSWTLAAEGRYGIAVGQGWALGPVARITHSVGSLGRFAESGGDSLDLAGDSGNDGQRTLYGGGLFARLKGKRGGGGVTALYVRDEDDPAEAELSLAGASGNPFRVRAARGGADHVELGAAGYYHVMPAVNFGIAANAAIAKGERSASVRAEMRWSF